MKFLDEFGSFTLQNPDQISYLYFPLASERGLKSSVTPNLGGDAKINQETFLLEPVSSENLHNNRSTRNVWVRRSDGAIASLTGASAQQEAERFSDHAEQSVLRAGLMWHTVKREISSLQLTTELTSFVPVQDNVEILKIAVTNQSDEVQTLTGYAAIPLYGRSADNIRDHRNVTSMLHRITVKDNRVEVCPTMSFDERGHRVNHQIYYAAGFGDQGECPDSFYPTVEEFLCEGGTFTCPGAVYRNADGAENGSTREGREAMGAFRFPTVTLKSGETKEYIVLLGSEGAKEAVEHVVKKYSTKEAVDEELQSTISYWKDQVNVGFSSSDADLDRLMKWICFQPFLRRIYGCSFLPHHDYGRGGRGWRDLWQDCLSLLLMEPQKVGRMIRQNFGGVRIDGTNATIIGDGDGNFIADRNGIARVWMDHALWPQMTTKLYIDQTGDVEILNQKVSYFRDAQIFRGNEVDTDWTEDQGNLLRTRENGVYEGSILEHLLIQQLTAFYEVGDHNTYRLRGADWNDALDMASEYGESVAFTYAYTGNLLDLAELIRRLDRSSSTHEVSLLAPIAALLEDDTAVYESAAAKKEVLLNYLRQVSGTMDGRCITISLEDLAKDLEQKAVFLKSFLRQQEWIDGGEDEGWFNSYYDNHGRRVEGFFDSGVRMMLTGQVFAIMSGVASREQVRRIVNSADHYLYRREIGGYRLNTNFHELKFDMGRMFGFAYGEKENGAVFSHMTVMFANALYKRGFAKEGWKALKTLADTALDTATSKIYPGIPEYFRADGRGMYHYLTGAASWYMMTMMTEVYGVRGEAGDLLLEPKLLLEQFDGNDIAAIDLTFAGKELRVVYHNGGQKEYGSYGITSISYGETRHGYKGAGCVIIPRDKIEALPEGRCVITVELQ